MKMAPETASVSDVAPVALDWPRAEIARITLMREAEFNTLSLEMIACFDEAVSEAATGKARALIITGLGKVFCAGGQIDYFHDPAHGLLERKALRDRYVRPINEVFGRLRTQPFVTIAAINGYALGGGCELAMACDLRLMSDAARIGLTEARLGVVPAGGGVQMLAKLVGRERALEIALFAEQLTAAEAKALGLISRHVPAAELESASLALASRVLQSGPDAVAEIKRAIYRCETADPQEADEIALDALAFVAQGEEWREAVGAFLEKRRPAFWRVAGD